MTYTDIRHATGFATGLAVLSQIPTSAVIALSALVLLEQAGRALRWIATEGPDCAKGWLEVWELFTARRPPASGDP